MLATFLSLFLSFFISSIPFLLLGSLISGLLAVYIPTTDILKLASGRLATAIAAGCFLGIFFPVGDVGVLPLVRRLMQKGASVPFGIAFLLSAPSINLVAMASTIAAFGIGPVFWGRIGLTLLVSIAASSIFSLEHDPAAVFRLLPVDQDVVSSLLANAAPTGSDRLGASQNPGQSERRKKLNQLAFTTADEFFYFGAFLVAGMLFTAGLRTVFPWMALVGASPAPLPSSVSMAVLAFVTSSNAMEIAFTSLGFAGSLSMGPMLVFLTLGSIVDLKRIPSLLALLRPKVVVYLVLLSTLFVVVMGVLAAYLLG
jgi:uncharacterized protein